MNELLVITKAEGRGQKGKGRGQKDEENSVLAG
jgi:hypothetical protein